MAGTYPDVPNYRLAYDLDGTVVVWIDRTNNNNVTQMSPTAVRNLNDEDVNTYLGVNTGNALYIVLLFPAPRDITHYYYAWGTNSYGLGASQWTQGGIDASYDTTNGLDGSWFQVRAAPPNQPAGREDTTTSVIPHYRDTVNYIRSVSGATGVSALRWGATPGGGSVSTDVSTWHIYGSIPGTSHRLEMWHPTLDQRLGAADLDFGDTPRSSTETRYFRMKNLSGSKTATDINIQFEAQTDGSPTNVTQYTASIGGASFQAATNIGSLSPAQISPVISVRRTTSSNAQFSLWALRMRAIPVTWV